jgi:hypothetical protein
VHINTRFGAEPGLNRRAISHANLLSLVPDIVEHWGKFQIANDGDTIHTAEGVTLRTDARDATFIRVSPILALALIRHFGRVPHCALTQQYIQRVDRLAHRPRAIPEFENRVFYARLLNIFVLSLPSNGILGLAAPQTLVLARVQECPITVPPPIPGTHSYVQREFDSTTPYVIDLQTISAVVGRFEWRDRIYIIDRSGGSVDPQLPDLPDGTV